jgi:hypothetical protein
MVSILVPRGFNDRFKLLLDEIGENRAFGEEFSVKSAALIGFLFRLRIYYCTAILRKCIISNAQSIYLQRCRAYMGRMYRI